MPPSMRAAVRADGQPAWPWQSQDSACYDSASYDSASYDKEAPG